MNDKRRPNVIYINSDDMGYGDLGCYGSTVNDTPTIDGLCEEGLKFTSFYASSPVCTPSRCSLMTGCYPPRVSINRVLFPGEPYGLNPGEYSLPRLFKEEGYRTMIIGKWHCGDQTPSLPLAFGFDEWFGLPYSNDMGMQKNRPITSEFPPLPLMSGNEVIEEQPDQRSLTERYTTEAVKFIRKSDEPFFLYFAHMHVHVPLYAEEHFVERSRNGEFGACMAEIDWSVRVLIHELEKKGILEDTIIVFTSDNGSRGLLGASNAPLRGRKMLTFEGGQRVPFIVYWKDHVRKGVTDDIASNIDVLPTFAGFFGRTLPGKIDGVDITSTIRGEGPARDESFYWGLTNREDTRGRLCAVRKGRWKLHREMISMEDWKYYPYMALYDLEEDIAEEHDLYDERPDVVKELQARFDDMAARLGNESQGMEGSEVRPCLTVEDPKPLTVYDPDHPYIIAMYDKDDMG